MGNTVFDVQPTRSVCTPGSQLNKSFCFVSIVLSTTPIPLHFGDTMLHYGRTSICQFFKYYEYCTINETFGISLRRVLVFAVASWVPSMKPSDYIFLRSEGRRSHLLGGGSLKSYIFHYDMLLLDHGIQKLHTHIYDYDTYFHPPPPPTHTHTHTGNHAFP
jgi:hypothetical protein